MSIKKPKPGMEFLEDQLTYVRERSEEQLPENPRKKIVIPELVLPTKTIFKGLGIGAGAIGILLIGYLGIRAIGNIDFPKYENTQTPTSTATLEAIINPTVVSYPTEEYLPTFTEEYFPTLYPTELPTSTQVPTATPYPTISPTKIPTFSPTKTPTTAPISYPVQIERFEVKAGVQMNKPGVYVNIGDAVHIEYIDGKWTGDKSYPNLYGACGWTYIDPVASHTWLFPPEQRGAALVGYIGSKHFFIGCKPFDFTANSSGYLSLGMSDCLECFWDNIGSLYVDISVAPAKKP